MTEDKKPSRAITVLIVIVAVVIGIWLFLWLRARARPPPECPQGTVTYMRLESFPEHPITLRMFWYDHRYERDLTALIPKSRRLGIFISLLDEYLSEGRILPIQYDCAIWQYDILVPPEA